MGYPIVYITCSGVFASIVFEVISIRLARIEGDECLVITPRFVAAPKGRGPPSISIVHSEITGVSFSYCDAAFLSSICAVSH